MNEDIDTDCTPWAQPHIALADLPRIRLDVPALKAAAKDIILEAPYIVRDVFVSAATDQRLLPYMQLAIEVRKMRQKDSDAH